jgi:predicted amidohydrolase YtcJ
MNNPGVLAMDQKLIRFLLTTFLCVVFLQACSQDAPDTAVNEPAQGTDTAGGLIPDPGPADEPVGPVATLYFGGDIITMNPGQPKAEALVVKDGKIAALGTRAELVAQFNSGTLNWVDLAGNALLPGFIDPHSHYFSALTVANQANVYAPPAGPGASAEAIVQALLRFRDANDIPPGELIQAYGYDDTVMPGGELLNRDHLDAAFPDNPVLVGHVSMHGGVMNSLALARWGFDEHTETPPGGVIVRKPGSNEPYGLIMETAFLPVFASLPKPSREQEAEWSRAGQMLYAQAGITTAHEGATHAEELAIMQRAAEQGAHIIDVVAFPFITELEAVLAATPVSEWGSYRNGLKIGGVKVTIDGSPQGRTAYFTTPYLTGGPGGEENWRGELTAPPEVIEQAVHAVYDLGVPLNLHANGDAAIDAFFAAHEKVAAGDLGKDRNVTMIHAQFARPDQLDKFVEYQVTPSFYTLHTYYFADAHIANRGREQAEYISPMRDAIDKGLAVTNHTDFYVAPLDQMFVLWSAVNRLSRSGEVIGPGQRVTVMEGLEAMTINAARQYGEDDIKGSLEPGKLADMVILNISPLRVSPDTIDKIEVRETIKAGETVYRAP